MEEGGGANVALVVLRNMWMARRRLRMQKHIDKVLKTQTSHQYYALDETKSRKFVFVAFSLHVHFCDVFQPIVQTITPTD